MQKPDDNTALRAAILAEGRTWVGTPVLHQHQVRGYGVDCWHLPKAVGEALGVLSITKEAFAPFAGYGSQPSPRLLLGALRRFYKPTTAPKVGDLCAIAWRPGLVMHLAMLGEFEGRQTLLHAWGAKGKVVEHGLAAQWPGLVHSWWRYPGLKGRT